MTSGVEDSEYVQLLQKAVRYLENGVEDVCDLMETTGGVPRFNYMTGGYTIDKEYVWDSWADFQWTGFLTGRIWLIHLLTGKQRYADVAMQLCERIGPVLASKPTVFSSTGIDMYYALTLGYQITKRESLKAWIVASIANYANIFDHKADGFLQIAGAHRLVIDTGLNLPSMLWAGQWDREHATLAYRHLDTVLRIGLVRQDGSSCHAAALEPETRAVTKLFSLQGWSDSSVWARGQAWAMLDFTHAYEASRDQRYLAAALSAADWYVSHAPPNWIPRYDYHDPDRESLPFDSCAAAIASSVLLRLAREVPERCGKYHSVARETIRALIINFLTPGGQVLHGTWGRMRHSEPGKPRLGKFPQEDVMPYGNYFLVECIFRELSKDGSVLSLAGDSGK